jgi:hypothetical protein
MLTHQTQVEYALLEARRDPSFHRFCTERINALRSKHQLPDDFEACLSVEAAPGIPLARALLELFMAQLDQPQWVRARDLAKGPALTLIPAQ